MVTLSGSAIWWTWETEDVFRRVRDGNKYAMKVQNWTPCIWNALECSAQAGESCMPVAHHVALTNCLWERAFWSSVHHTQTVLPCLQPADARSPLQELSSKLTGQLADLTSMVRRDLGGEARKKVNTLIITDVHARDIIETFVRDSVMDAREFAWESQLRYYWDRTADDLMIRQCTGQSGVLARCLHVLNSAATKPNCIQS